MKTRKFLLTFTFIVSLFPTIAQDFETNLQKYWFYRERLKNFVVQGDGTGCGIISNIISWGSVEYRDQVQVLGNYISMLAMEHYLLRTQGQNLDENTKELFYAIEAFNRLDKYAETYWNDIKFGAYNNTGYVPNITNDLNGFFIRDDTPYNLLDYDYNGISMENHLGNHWAPFADGKRKKRMYGTYTLREYRYDTGNPSSYTETFGGPWEMSLDQVIEFMGGMVLTAKFVDPNLVYNNGTTTVAFSDGETNIIQEVKNICHRISTHCQSGNWTINNPVTGTHVKAQDLNNSAIDAGARFQDLCKGFALANSLIQDNFTPYGPYWQTNYSNDPVIQTISNTAWAYYFNNPHPKRYEETKILLLAALSDIWGSLTLSTITSRSYQGYKKDFINFPHYPMIHALIFNKQNIIPNSVYECMLNAAQPYGPNVTDYNYEWNGQRLLYGPNNGQTLYSDGENWGEYMYYFNMYCMYNPGYMQNYRKIPPLELCEYDITKTGSGNNTVYKEWDWKKFAALNTITAGNINNSGDYIIKQYDGNVINVVGDICDATVIGNYVPYIPSPIIWPGNSGNVPGEPFCNYDAVEATDPTKVTFVAGEYISMQPGFEVHAGAELDAYTQTDLKQYQPGQSQSCIPCSNCKPGGDDEIGNGFRDKSYNRMYKVFSFIPGEILVVTPHVIFKVKDDGKIGENMFGINELAPGNCPNDYETGSNKQVIGYQRFTDPNIGSHGIVDVEFMQGHTFVAFADGRILRVQGTGGTGQDMFGVTDNNPGLNITLLGGAANYNQGYYKFQHNIADLLSMQNELLISFNFNSIISQRNSTMLKFNTTGSPMSQGSGSIVTNFWGYNQTNYSGALGHFEFRGKITRAFNAGGNLYVCTKNSGNSKGKILKVSGTGGTGANMFNVTEYGNNSSFAFAHTGSGNYYYLGDENFTYSGSNAGSYITDMQNDYVSGNLFFGMKNGKAFRVEDGGTGHHMFNIEEYNSTFGVYDQSYYVYLRSFQDYSNGAGGVANQSYIRSMEVVYPYLLMGFHNGEIRKYDIAATPNLNGQIGVDLGYGNFETSVVSFTKIKYGCPRGENPDNYDPDGNGLRTAIPEDPDCYCYNKVFIGLAGDQMICARNAGGTGDNFYGLSYRDNITGVSGTQQDHGGYTALCGYNYFIGSQNFKSICAGARMQAPDSSLADAVSPLTEEEYLAMAEEESLVNEYDYSYLYTIKVWPNPSQGSFKVHIGSVDNEVFNLQITDVTGKSVWESTVNANEETTLGTGLKPGLYYVKALNEKGNVVLNEKLIIQ